MKTKLKALAFDTGGTILDWHSGICGAFERVGTSHGIVRDWHNVTNDYRRLAMKGIVGQSRPGFNMDDVHRTALDDTLASHALDAFTPQDRRVIFRTWHELTVWPDFAAAMTRLRENLPVISFTMLPLALVLDVSRKNNLRWDAIISCEMIGTYKPNPEAYLTAARWMALEPHEILMVACHNFDLNAARSCGYETAFVRRPAEWGPQGPPDPVSNPDNDITVEDFPALAVELGF